MIASDAPFREQRHPDQQHQQQLSSEYRVEPEQLSSSSSEESTSRPSCADDRLNRASLTPAPLTPIKEAQAATLVDENNVSTTSNESAVDRSAGSEESGGPALDDEDDDDDVEQDRESNCDLAEGEPDIIRDPDYNPEAEYLSDPDFHDERPGKKGLEEIKAEQRKRRESFRNKTSSSPRIPEEGVNLASEDELEEGHLEVSGRPEKAAAQVEAEERKLPLSLEADHSEEEGESGACNECEPIRATSATVSEQVYVQSVSISSPAASERRSELCELPSESSQLTQFSSNQVTATEDRAEHFADDESTLAGDLGSLVQQQQQRESGNNSYNAQNIPGPNSTDSSLSQQESESEVDDKQLGEDEDSTLRSIEEVSRVQQPSSRRHESLDDVSWIDSDEARLSEKVNGSKEDRSRLVGLLSAYCRQLVEHIHGEAVRQIESIIARDQSGEIATLSLMHAFEIKSQLQPAPKSDDSSASSRRESECTKVCAKKVYTSSMYYNDQRDSFPTIEQQVERSRSIADRLEGGESAPTNGGGGSQQRGPRELDRRASSMFRRRRERMRCFTIGNPIEESESEQTEESSQSMAAQRRLRRASLESVSSSRQRNSLAQRGANCEQLELDDQCQRRVSIDLGECDKFNSLSLSLTDTEYEAPKVKRRALPTRATTTPLSERRQRHIECFNSQVDGDSKAASEAADEPTYKPFLDSSTLKDIQKLRLWSPSEEFNEHNSVSPEICLKLVQDLKSSTSPGGDRGDAEAADETRADSPESPASKGRKLFERLRLQSSDWIVTAPEMKLEIEHEARAEPTHKVSAGCESLSRASISEETVMVADESSNEQFVAEILPVVSSHMQPKLELATVTRTPSFSTSSWRVIECESPDLLTSRDEPDDDDSGGATLLGDDTVAPPGGDRDGKQAETRGRQLCADDREGVLFASLTKAHNRQLHQATTLEWRPQVMTPIQLTTEELDDEGQFVGANGITDETRPVSHTRANSLSPIRASEPRDDSIFPTAASPPRRRSNDSGSQSSVANNYQQLVEQSNRQYRSYYYPHGSEWVGGAEERCTYKTNGRESFGGELRDRRAPGEGDIFECRKVDSRNRRAADHYRWLGWRRPESEPAARACPARPEFASRGANASSYPAFAPGLWRPDEETPGKSGESRP